MTTHKTTLSLCVSQTGFKPARVCFIDKPRDNDEATLESQDKNSKIAELLEAHNIPMRFFTVLDGRREQKKLIGILLSDKKDLLLDDLREGEISLENISDNSDLRRALSRIISPIAWGEKIGMSAKYGADHNLERYDNGLGQLEIDAHKEEYEKCFTDEKEDCSDTHSELRKSLNWFLEEYNDDPAEDEIEEFLISLGYIHPDDNQQTVGPCYISPEEKQELAKDHQMYSDAKMIIRRAITRKRI